MTSKCKLVFIYLFVFIQFFCCICYESGTGQRTSPILTHLIFTKALWSRYYEHLFYLWSNWGTEWLSNMPKVTQLANDWAQIWTKGCLQPRIRRELLFWVPLFCIDPRKMKTCVHKKACMWVVIAVSFTITPKVEMTTNWWVDKQNVT